MKETNTNIPGGFEQAVRLQLHNPLLKAMQQ